LQNGTVVIITASREVGPGVGVGVAGVGDGGYVTGGVARGGQGPAGGVTDGEVSEQIGGFMMCGLAGTTGFPDAVQ
jgi:hypothetical protein